MITGWAWLGWWLGHFHLWTFVLLFFVLAARAGFREPRARLRIGRAGLWAIPLLGLWIVVPGLPRWHVPVRPTTTAANQAPEHPPADLPPVQPAQGGAETPTPIHPANAENIQNTESARQAEKTKPIVAAGGDPYEAMRRWLAEDQEDDQKPETAPPLQVSAKKPLEASNLNTAPTVTPSGTIQVQPPLPQWHGLLTIVVIGWLVLLYALGAVVIAGWHLLGVWRLQQLYNTACDAPDEMYVLLEETVGSVFFLPRLRLVDKIGQAMAVGLRRPTILLPGDLVSKVSDFDLTVVFRHEWAHIRHRDLWTAALLRTFMVALYIQPLFWVLRWRMIVDQEFVADSEAARGTEPVSYASALLKWVRLDHYQEQLTESLAFLGGRSQLRERIARLLNTPATSTAEPSSVARWAVPSAVVIAAIFLGSGVIGEPARPEIARSKIADSNRGTGANSPADAETHSDMESNPKTEAGITPADIVAWGKTWLDPRSHVTNTAPPVRVAKWKLGNTYRYSLHIEVESLDTVDIWNGVNNYTTKGVDYHGTRLLYQGNLSWHQRKKEQRQVGPPGHKITIPVPFLDPPRLFPVRDQQVVLDPAGQPLRVGDFPLPCGLGDEILLALEPCPESRSTGRETSRNVVLIPFPQEQESNFFPSIPKMYRPQAAPWEIEWPSWRDPALPRLPGTLKQVRIANWRVDARFLVRESWSAESREQHHGLPRVSLQGTALTVWDCETGLVASREFQGTWTERGERLPRQRAVSLRLEQLPRHDGVTAPKKSGVPPVSAQPRTP